MKLHTTITALLAALAASASAGVTLTPLASFGGGDGWRAPNEILAGDIGGTNDGTNYNYLRAGSLERGLAYNPVADKLVLVSRNGGIFLRLLNPATGEDAGGFSNGTGIITGGTFVGSTVACGADGATYLANLTTNATTSAFKIYKWADPGDDAPTVYFSNTITGFSAAARLGDSLDVFDTPGAPTLAAGCGSGVIGYAIISGAPASATAIGSFTPAGPATGDFRLGITFAGAGDAVWGRQSSGSGRRTTFSGSTGTYVGDLPGITGSQALLDYAVVDGRPLLAVCNISNSQVSIYDVTIPAAPTLAATGNATSGTLTANGNGVGSVKWGAISGNTATLYAMSTNQGIQAFTVTITPDVTPPGIASSPSNRTVYERGQTTFTVTATGTAPFTYQWSLDGNPIPAATSASYTINPVTPSSAGSYTCRVTNSAGFADTTAAVLTTAPSVDSAALTPAWSVAPLSRPYLANGGDTERGIDYHPPSNRAFVASRNPTAQVLVLDGTTGADVHALDTTGVSGGQFPLMFPGVNADGAVYVCNLSNTGDGSSFKIYKWDTDAPGVPPGTAFDGNPIGSRIGDSFDVRGSGGGTQCVAGSRNLNQFVVFNEFIPGVLTPFPITVTGVPAGSFALGIAFGEGDTVWAHGDGGALYYCSFDTGTGTGAIIATYGPADGVPNLSVNPLGVDPVNRCLAMIDTGNSDNVRFYSYTAGAVPVLTLLDQEFLSTDNANLNRVGSVAVGGGRVYALDTNNGIAAYSTLKPALPALGAITPGPGANEFSVVITGTPGFSYVVESSTDLVTWMPFITVPFTAATHTVQLPTAAPRTQFRARLGP